MTLPLTQPTIIRARERPNPFEVFLESFLRGQQLQQQREGLRLRREEFELEQERFKAAQKAQQAEAEQLAATGQGIQAALPGLEPPVQAQLGVPGLPAGGGLVGMGGIELPGGPFSAAAQAAGLAGGPQAVAQTMQQVLPLSVEARQVRAEQRGLAAQRALDESLASIPDETVRSDLRKYIAFDNAGVQLDAAAKATLMPSLYPAGIPPSMWDTAYRIAALSNGELSFGQVARGIPEIAQFLQGKSLGALEDYRFPPEATGAGRLSEQRLKVKMYGVQMREALNTINQLVGYNPQTGTLDPTGERMGWLARTSQNVSTTLGGGGPLGLVGKALGDVLNAGLPQEQQRLVNSTLAVANAYRYLVSGQQTSDREYNVILNYISISPTDKPETIKQKLDFLQRIVDTAEEVSGGLTSGTDADALLAQYARMSNLPPDVQQALTAPRVPLAGGRVPDEAQRLIETQLQLDPNGDPASQQAILQRLEEMARGQRRRDLIFR